MDKLEKHIKEKLEERTITPSPGAWDKIASQLDAAPKKKGKKWQVYAMAASFVGILLLSLLFVNKGKTIPEIQVVEEKVDQIDMEKKNETQSPRQELTKTLPVQEETKVVNNGLEPMPEENPKGFTDELPISQPVLAQEETKQLERDKLIKESDALITQKVEEVVAQVQHMEGLNRGVSDAEVDSLLREAQKQIMADKLFPKNGSVDAMTLLAEVEEELDESFRDQIFDALKEGYFKLRTAVADRNN
ncbi:hypothetical protein D2V93_00035 [Flagellimonas taeanensis]|uniref:hypothetical protein n=1 Tax=Flavobacteriaceae TaxID=49546 RepID=UPI000E6941D5|nr:MULTISPECIES: hypothetical protein [Allomuricauda]MDC6384260.1 hypothetical protein [Muricauda sp. SK9]RIV49620.1 hypothetical protein D2V93_12530 [Allomuricauda taeanensis]RIV53819.1 hypothetical protein D2V93_00035 [Allomuricauda taeanensis]